MWNSDNAAMKNERRSNKVEEGWHSEFQSAMLSKQATIRKFIYFIKKDERDDGILISQLNSGHSRIRYPIKKISH